MTTRVLLVCLGNICRSPTAEAAVREAATQAGLDVVVDSAGTGAWHVGDPPDARMVAAAAEDGLDLAGAARQVVAPDDFRDFDLVVAMDASNHADLLALAPDEHARRRVRLFRDYAGEIGQGVPDPYDGGPDGFREVVGIVRRAAAGLVAAIARGEP